VEAEVDRVGTEALHQRLQQVDPLSAAKLHRNDKRRIIRALEVYALTGQPISHLQTQFDGKHAERCSKVYVVSRSRASLHQRIQQRTDSIYQRGLVDEVAKLTAKYGQLSRTALQGVGYQEALDHLAGKCTVETAMEETKIRTRRYARRQETWFRGLEECQWVSVDDTQSVEQVVAEICGGRNHANHANQEKPKESG
jgi:tRNA dimethylallyltransferase